MKEKKKEIIKNITNKRQKKKNGNKDKRSDFQNKNIYKRSSFHSLIYFLTS